MKDPITLFFFHPDRRINFFSVIPKIKHLLVHYYYQSSGYEDGFYNRNHLLRIPNSKRKKIITALEADGWTICYG